MESFKTLCYRAYFYYFKRFPVNIGKSFIGRILYYTIGDSIFEVDGNKFELCPQSLIDRYIIETGTFDGTIQRYIEQELASGDVFIDIGANIGFYSIVASKNKNVEVLSFEPSPREIARLKKNISINNRQNIKLFPIALGAEKKNLILSLAELSNPGMNSIINLPNAKHKIQVQAERLDSIIDCETIRRVKIIKIDVEGFEYEVLLGMEQIIHGFKGSFIVEISKQMMEKHGRDVQEIYNWMKKYSFQPTVGDIEQGQYDEIFVYNQVYDL